MNKVANKNGLLRFLTYVFLIVFTISMFIAVKTYAKNKDLNIDKVEIVEKSDGVTGDITSSSNDIIKDTITFHKLNDYVVYKIKIDNDLDKDIIINTITDNNDNPYIAYEYDKHKNETIKSGKSTDLLVKVIYKNDMSDLSKRNQTSNVRFTIDFSEGEKTIGINPKTNDGIGISFIILIVSSIGLITCLIIKTKKVNKTLKILLLSMMSLISLPLITKAITLTLNLSINTDYNFYDKVILTYNIDGEEKTKVVPYGTKVEEVDFNYPEGYSVVNWEDENNNAVSLNDSLKEDTKIEGNLVYSETAKITATAYNKFSYTANKAKAYYVSTSDTIPQTGSVQDTFALDTWTTVTETPMLNLTANQTYYVFLMDNSDNVSVNKASIGSVNISISNTYGVKMTSSITGYWHLSLVVINNADYEIPSSDSYSTLAFEGTKYTYSSSVAPGFENYKCTKNGVETLTSDENYAYEDTSIECSATIKTISVSFDPNGGIYENSEGLVVKTTEFASSTLYNVGVPTKEGYYFDGWYSELTGGDIVFSNKGYQTSYGTGKKYFANVSGGLGGPMEWVYPENITLYAHWSPAVTVTTTDYNTFEYNSPYAVAYYVSTSSTTPTAGNIQNEFELNKWTTSQSTGDLILNSTDTYYVWAIDNNGIITSKPGYIMSHKLYNPISDKYTLEVRLNDSNGDVIDFESNRTAYVLSKTKIYVLFEGINDYSVMNGTVSESNCDHDIYDTSTVYYCTTEALPILSGRTITVTADIAFGAATYYNPPLIITP